MKTLTGHFAYEKYVKVEAFDVLKRPLGQTGNIIKSTRIWSLFTLLSFLLEKWIMSMQDCSEYDNQCLKFKNKPHFNYFPIVVRLDLVIGKMAQYSTLLSA